MNPGEVYVYWFGDQQFRVMDDSHSWDVILVDQGSRVLARISQEAWVGMNLHFREQWVKNVVTNYGLVFTPDPVENTKAVIALLAEFCKRWAA